MSGTRVATGAARAVARLAKQVEVAITPLDLSLPQYRVLGFLADGSTASSVLARQLAVSPPSVTAVVDGLVGRGLVERRADPQDRRRLTLLLTRDGKRLLVAADVAAEARLDEIAEFLPNAGLEEPPEALAAGLDGWNRALDRTREARLQRDA
jgi:DNA-binding MarR family transcriptional regulator